MKKKSIYFHELTSSQYKHAFTIQFRVIYALILREMRTRYGRFKLSYAWAVIEPIIHVTVIAAIFSLSKRPPPQGMTLLGLLVTGIVPWLLFLHTFDNVMGSYQSNKSLLMYPYVKPLDTVIARALLEFLTIVPVFIFLVLIAIYSSKLNQLSMNNTALVIFALLMLTIIGLGSGMIFASIGLFYPSVERVVLACIKPLYFISGIFFTLTQLPPFVREYLDWNPIAHAIDILRDATFHGYAGRYSSIIYLLVFSLVILFLGLFATKVTRYKVEIL